jgi:single-strand DNA-binding protein
MEIIGRITKDAVTATLKDGRNVTNFTLVVNDYYKPKTAAVGTQIATYFNCSYWLSSAMAAYLKKGVLAEVSGRVGVQTYTTKQGETKAALTFHANSIKLHGGSGRSAEGAGGVHNGAEPIAAPVVEAEDDLPF